MLVFKKNKKSFSETKESIKNSGSLKEITKKIKERKIGFGRKHKKTLKGIVSTENEEIKTTEDGETQTTNFQSQLKGNRETKKDFENEDDFLEDVASEEEIIPEEPIKSEKKEEWSKSKRKAFIKKHTLRA